MSLLEKIKVRFSVPNEILAIECVRTELGQNFYLSHLKINKGQVDLMNNSSATQIPEMLKPFDKALPIFLLMGGRKILNNTISVENDENIVRQAFPNIPKEETLFDVDKLAPSKYHVSVARKEVVLETIEMIQKFGFRVIELNIGIGSIHQLLKKQFETKKIELSIYQIDLKDFKVLSNGQKVNKEKLNLFGQIISDEFIVSYLNGLNFFLKKKYNSNFESIEFWRRDWFFENLIRKTGKFLLALFLVVLSTSFLVWNNYHDSNQSKTFNNETYKASLQLMKKLESDFNEKQAFLEINKSSNLPYSKMMDQLALKIPKGLYLKSVNLSPLRKREKRTNLFRFKKEEIKIEGETVNYIIFNSWFTSVKKLDWVSDIEILGYKEQNKGHRADFSINIRLK